MTDTERMYDAAFDKKDYYDQIAASLDDVLVAIHELGDKDMEVSLLIDQRDYARAKAAEWAEVMHKCVKLERASSKAGIGFYD